MISHAYNKLIYADEDSFEDGGDAKVETKYIDLTRFIGEKDLFFEEEEIPLRE